MSRRKNRNAPVLKARVTKHRNERILKTPANEGTRKISCIEEPFMAEHKEICTPARPLLPASAAAFAHRALHILLGVNGLRLNSSVRKHQNCLTKKLLSSTAIWTLASLTLPKAPDTELEDSILAIHASQLIHIEAYIILKDMLSQNEIVFKLVPDSIESLIEYHRDIHCVNLANTHTDSQLEVKKLHKEFSRAIHKFVYRTDASALEGLEEDGSGELSRGKSGEVKTNILRLLLQAPPQKTPPHQEPPALQKLRPRLQQ